MITTALAPSTKQLDYARSLYREHAVLTYASPAFIEATRDQQEMLRTLHAECTAKLDTMNRQEISRAIDSMKSIVDRLRIKSRERATTTTTPALNLEPGIYKVNGTVYQIRPNREKTRLYAKKLVEFTGERLTEANTIVRIEFEYAPGAIYNIKPEHKMPLEEGKALILRYGKCICCGRVLKAAKSVEAGIGPICIKYFS